MSERKLARIPLKNIRENPVAIRSVNRKSDDYISFAGSVRKDGVLNPILVREITSPEGTQLYGIIEGLHRYTASLDAGHADIPAQIIEMNDGQVMEAQLIGNAHRIETRPVEYSKHLQRILAGNPMLTLTELAGKLNKSNSWLSDRLGILKLDDSIAGLVDEGKINLSNAYSLAKLPKDEQQAFVDRAMTLSPQEFSGTILARKREIEKARRQGKDAKPEGFVAVPHVQKLADLKSELESPSIGPALVKEAGVTTAEEGFALGVKWALHMDARSIEAAKVKDDARKEELEKQRVKASADRARKRAEEAAAAVAKMDAEALAAI